MVLDEIAGSPSRPHRAVREARGLLMDLHIPPCVHHHDLVAEAVSIADGRPWDYVPEAFSAGFLRRKSVLLQTGNENDGPLHSLCLMSGHHLNRIGACMPGVSPSFRVIAGRLMLEKPREPLVLGDRVSLKVNLLVVGNNLAELAEVVVHDLAIRDVFLA